MSRTTFHLFVAIMIGLFISAIGNGKENMPNMPLIKPHRTVTIKGNEDFETTKGFGENEPNIKMMNLMMVEGSGYEGMDMSHMDHSNKEQTIQKKGSTLYSIELSTDPKKAKVGSYTVEFSILDSKTRKAVPKLELTAKVYMTTMDMGISEAHVKEISPGNYRVKAPFAMAGTWAITLKLPDGMDNTLEFDVH